ncbi:MAG: zinc ribbon domain-containing protein [Desulfobacterales bacterium]|nr:zinc ribbon domain-containing protein [Desulfobacterales bacterium]
MPLYDFLCLDCGALSEILMANSDDQAQCQHCQSQNLRKLLSAHSSYNGKSNAVFPGTGDTACCGSSPATSHCNGPGSCCGKHN